MAPRESIAIQPLFPGGKGSAFLVREEGDGLRAPADAGSKEASFGLGGELAEDNGLHQGFLTFFDDETTIAFSVACRPFWGSL